MAYVADSSQEAAPAPTSDEITDIHLGTRSFSQLYLFAFATQGELFQHIRTQTLKQESVRYPEILAAWQAQQPIVQQQIQTEIGFADQMRYEDLPIEVSCRLREI